MTADVLRAAAKAMRERAEGATSSPWVGTRAALRRGGTGVVVSQPEGKFVLCDPQSDARVEDARHIASWHPMVALAVAEWLDTAGADLWAHGPLCSCADGCLDCDDEVWQPHVRRALAVARAYLGTAA